MPKGREVNEPMTSPMSKSHIPARSGEEVLQVSGFSGLDRRGGIGATLLRDAEGLETRFLPELSTAEVPREMALTLPGGTPLSIHGMGRDLFIFSNQSGMGLLTRVRPDGDTQTVELGTLQAGAERTLVCFNRYTNPLDPLNGRFVRAGIIYPDMFSLDLDAEQLSVIPFMPADGVMPPVLSHACVHLSRIFGTHGDCILASAYNNCMNFNLDTATDTGAANAWASAVQSGVTGEFTAATVFDGHPLLMREDITYVINGTKNPFRIAELLPVGACSERSVAKTAGCLFFTTENEVYRYDGETLHSIGAPLSKTDLRGACATACEGRYYLALPDERCVFVFDTEQNSWGTLGFFTDSRIVSATTDTKNCYFLTEDGRVFTNKGAETGDFFFQTAPIPQNGMHPYRPVRLTVLFSAEKEAKLTASAIGSDGRETALLSCEGNGETGVAESRSYLPKDVCFSLAFRGSGRVRIHGIRLAAVDGE